MLRNHFFFLFCRRCCVIIGGEIASTFDHPELVKLGECKLIEEIMIGEDKLIHFSGVEMGAACTIVLRGASEFQDLKSIRIAMPCLSKSIFFQALRPMCVTILWKDSSSTFGTQSTQGASATL